MGFSEFFGKAVSAVASLGRGIANYIGLGGGRRPGQPQPPMVPASQLHDDSPLAALHDQIDQAMTGQSTTTGWKTWKATFCNTRPSHKLADGQTVGIEEYFVVGGCKARYPGDPLLPDREKCNCKCYLLMDIQPGITSSNLQPSLLSRHDVWDSNPRAPQQESAGYGFLSGLGELLEL